MVLDQVRLLPATLPELGLDEITLTTTLAGKQVAYPFFINAMTGGSPQTDKINEKLAYVAKQDRASYGNWLAKCRTQSS